MSEFVGHLPEEPRENLAGEKGKLKNLLQKILGKRKGGGQILESEKRKQFVQVEIIDERDPGNLLSDTSRNVDLSFNFGGLPYSAEGFAENPKRQSELASFLIKKLDLKKRGTLLDVGFGANIHISNTFADEGIEAYAIDQQQHDHKSGESMWHAPRKLRKNDKGVEILSGDIADIGEKESQLKEKSFGLILFNGSWTSGGNNWTAAGEVMEAKYHNRPDETETLSEFMEKEKDKILQLCKNQLSRDGLIGVISSRYAFHGAGYGYDQLPEEKLIFFDLYDRFQQLGAKSMYLFGVSQEGFDQMLARSIKEYPKEHDKYKLKQEKIDTVREELRTIANLPDQAAYFEKSHIQSVKEKTKNIPKLNAIARIDAIFAEF